MRNLLNKILIGFSAFLAANNSFATFVSFIEGPAETDVTVVLTGVVTTEPVIATPEYAKVVGFHHPGISPSPLTVGSRSAGLWEPGAQGVLSDYVLLTAGEIHDNPDFGLAQDLTIEFFSEDTPLADFLQKYPNFPFGGAIEETGTLQDISELLGTLPEGLIVSVLSYPGEENVPDSGSTFALLGSISFGLVAFRRKFIR